jgi:hypothetical protein
MVGSVHFGSMQLLAAMVGWELAEFFPFARKAKLDRLVAYSSKL